MRARSNGGTNTQSDGGRGGPRRIVALAVAFATVVGAMALSVPSAGVQAQAAQCSNISSLACDDLAVGIPFSLDFDGTDGGLVDQNGVGTGFTMVQAPSARLTTDGPATDSSIPGYEPGPAPGGDDPAEIEVSGGALKLTSSKGIFFRNLAASPNTNSGLNVLGVGVDASEVLEIRTTIDPIDFTASATSSAQQAGVWFGLNEDNYAKLVVAKNGTQADPLARAQLQVEVAGGALGAAGSAPLEVNSLNFNFSAPANSNPIELVMRVDPVALTVTGTYQIGTAAPVALGTGLSIPASFTPAPAAPGTPPAPYAGVFVTHRNAAANAPIVASFQNFSVRDLTPPATPADVVATPADGSFEVSWSPVADAVSYIVVVDGVAGAPQTSPPYFQSAVNGTPYDVEVIAVDASGNESDPSAVVTVTPNAGDITPPEVPIGVEASVGPLAANVADVTVTWSASADSEGDLDGYSVFRDGAPIGDVAADVLTFTDAGVGLGDYEYTVAAFDSTPNVSAQSVAVAVMVTNAVCSNISPLACDMLDLSVPFALDFDGTEGGIGDADGIGTGFTMVQAPSTRLSPEDDPVFDQGLPGYEPSKLEVVGGELVVSSTRGLAYRNASGSSNTNSQINGLGVGIDPADASQVLEIRTTIDPIDFSTVTGTAAQAGIWFGADEENFTKLVLVRTAATTAKVQLQVEVAGGALGNTAAAPLELNTVGTLDVTQPIELVLTVDPSTSSVIGQYSVNGGTTELVEQVGTSSGQPPEGTDSLGIPAAVTADPFVGVYASSRNAGVGQSFDASFQSFSITELTPPAAPANVTVTPGETSALIEWDAVADAASYKVLVAGLPEETTTETSFDVTGLTTGQNYEVTVVAVDAAGNESDPSDPAPFTTVDSTGPDAPTGVTVTPGEELLDVSWNAVADAVEYIVSVDGAAEPATTELSLQLTGLTGGQTYSITIVAVDAAANPSNPSAAVEGTPTEPVDVTPPDAPTGVTVTPGDQTLDVSWVAVADAVEYIVSVNGTPEPATTATTLELSGLTNGQGYSITVVAADAAGNVSAPSAAVSGTPTAPVNDPTFVENDFDGDAKSDIGVYRSGRWIVAPSSGGPLLNKYLGTAGDTTFTGDFDGDGLADVAYFRNGRWAILQSSTSSAVVRFLGNSSDVPVVGDFDGDGITDIGLYRSGTWFLRESSTSNLVRRYLGTATDRPITADFDGDGITDVGYYRSGRWAILLSSSNSAIVKFQGSSTHIPVPADFDGDGKADIAVFRNGQWTIELSSTNTVTNRFLGTAGDIPILGDYDGDGITDLGYYRSGRWAILQSSNATATVRFLGNAADIPLGGVLTAVAAPTLALNAAPTSAAISATEGSASSETVTITPSSGTALVSVNESAPWLTVQGLGGNQFSLVADSAGLPVGQVTTNVTFSAPNYTSVVVPVTFDVEPAPLGNLTATPEQVDVTVVEGSTAFETVAIVGDGSLPALAVSESASWLTIVAQPGNTFDFVVDSAGLAVGTVTADVVFAAPGYNDVTVPASFEVTAAPLANLTANPNPVLLTAEEGASTSATVAVTGDGSTPALNLSESAPWLSVSALPNNQFTFTADAGLIGSGQVFADVAFSAPGYAELIVPVTFDVTAPQVTPCAIISSLSCADVVLDFPVDLTFDGADGGLADKDGQDLGFTMVDPHSQPRLAADLPISNPAIKGYEPSLLDIAAGTLKIDARKGIQYLNAPTASTNNDTLINGLGVGLNADGRTFDISTTIQPLAWPASGGAEQTGLWFGLDEDNYIKLVVANQATATLQVQMLRETGGLADTAATTDALDVIAVPETATVALRLRIDAVNGDATAFYAVNGGAEVQLAEGLVDSIAVPANFTAGTLLSDGVTTASFAGLFATNRNGTNTPGIDPVFTAFSVTAEPLPTPTLLATPATTSLSAEIGQIDSTSIGVSVSPSANVPVTASSNVPWLAVTPSALTPTSLTVDADATGLAEGTYPATVTIASDGYETVEIPFSFQVFAEAQALDLKINFQPDTQVVQVGGSPTTVDLPAPAGYLKDVGQAFGPRTGTGQGSDLSYGWLIQEDNAPLDMVANTRDRNRASIADQRLDTLIHMQYGDIDPPGTTGNLTPGQWEIAVPDGLYEVTVAVGDQPGAGTVYDSQHALNVEGAVAIEEFQAAAADEYETATVTVGVSDGRLTVDAVGGSNTKLNYIDISEVPAAPHITAMRPLNRSVGFDPTDGVSADIEVPGAGVGVDPTSLAGNVFLIDVATGLEVPSTVGSSGGNDNISLQPDEPLTTNKVYRFVVTSGVTSDDAAAVPFVPFTSVFTAGTTVTPPTPGTFEPVTGVSFEKVEQTLAQGDFIASMVFGPDGKMYTSTIGQGIYRYDVAVDGALSNRTKVGPAALDGRAIIGIVADTSMAPGQLGFWVTHATSDLGNELAQWGSKISHISGPTLATINDIFVNLPRSNKDHLTNSIGYGPNGDLYLLQGSNQAAGDTDGSWGTRGEKLLTAALLHFSPTNTQVLAAKAGGAPIDVQTSGGGTYDPYLPGAPLKIYASGIRNAYDFVYHSNGHIYVPTNGTAGGGNSPGVNVTPDTGTPTSALRTGQVPGDYTNACATRRMDGQPYTAGDVPAITNHATQEDHLYDVKPGKYYGHPNPERCEWVLHSGNPTAGQDPFERVGGSNYPVGVLPDPNYDGVAYNFGYNKSPNGVIEYQSNTFGGQLQGRVVVVRFSNNNDLVFLQTDGTGEILGAQYQEGITGVPNTTIGGVGSFADPLEVVEDPSTGNLYVNQFDRGGGQQKLFLLRVPAGQQAQGLEVNQSELVFSAAVTSSKLTDDVTVNVTNVGTNSVTLGTSVVAAASNSAPGDYQVTAGNGVTVASGATVPVTVRFDPTAAGLRNAVLALSDGSDTITVPLFGLAAPGIEGGNEPTLSNALIALGHPADVGWTGLAGGITPTERGDETYEPLFEKAAPGPVGMKALAQYAPLDTLKFGWYTGDGSAANRTEVGTFASNAYQELLPALANGGTSFDPLTATFGVYYDSAFFNRIGYTEDEKNGTAIRRARIYPATNRAGAVVPNSFIVAFEDASNGDYQDYVFLLTNVKPAGSGPIDPPPPTAGAVKVNFQSAAAAVPADYLRDFGQPYGPRSDAAQGTGLTYGWLDQTTRNPIDLSVGGTGPGNGRDRNFNADQRYDTLMNLQSADIVGTPNGTSARALWELAVVNGTYQVTIAVGDPGVYSDPEFHTANVEGVPAITRYEPTGAQGSATRHSTATVTVPVNDGRLTIDAIGGFNTKYNFVEIVPVSAEPPAVQVNFQTVGAPTPSGWVADTGGAFEAGRGFGWLVGTTPTDRTNAARARTAPAGDPLLQTFNIIQNDVVTTITNGVWEYALPNGEYFVQASVGDAEFVDSTHSIVVEGVDIIGEFVPSTANQFQASGGFVNVSDGRLTMQSGFGGANTKVNWITITAAGEDETPPAVNFVVDGTTVSGGAYKNTATVTINASDIGSGVEFLNFAVNGAAAQAYTAPIVLDTPGDYEIVATAVDNNGNDTTETLNLSVAFVPPSQAEISLVNQSISRRDGAPIAGFYDDWLTMSRLNGGIVNNGTNQHLFQDTATLTIQNTGVVDALNISALTLSTTQFAFVTPPVLPLSIPPGGSVDVPVRLVHNTGSNGVRVGTLTIVSDDENEPSTVVQLRGLWQSAPEGGNEPTFRQIIASFGWTTGTGTGIMQSPVDSPLFGEEVRSNFWQRADSTRPLIVRQIAAYHGCFAGDSVSIGGASFGHAPNYCQSAMPIKANGTIGEAQASPTGTFAITAAGYTSNGGNNGNLGIRTFPVRDRDNQLVPNSWIVIQDFVQNGCGAGSANCDYNDNMYLVTNLEPVAPSDTVAPAAPTGLAGSLVGPAVSLNWDDGGADVAGFLVERASTPAGPWTRIVAQPIRLSGYLDNSPLAGNSAYRVIAVDASMNESAPSAVVEVDTPDATLPTIRINAGGPAVTTPDGLSWAADTSGGRSYTNPNVTQINATTSDVLYFTERSDTSATWGYDIAVPDGTYTVKLHFAEIYFGAPGGGLNNGGPGKRVFSINLEGGSVEKANYDINAEVGPITADIEEFVVTVSGGILDVDFSASVNQPKLSAIEIIPF